MRAGASTGCRCTYVASSVSGRAPDAVARAGARVRLCLRTREQPPAASANATPRARECDEKRMRRGRRAATPENLYPAVRVRIRFWPRSGFEIRDVGFCVTEGSSVVVFF